VESLGSLSTERLIITVLILIHVILERLLKSRYEDIKHLFDIENKWNKESDRRAKDPESVKNEDAPTDNKWF